VTKWMKNFISADETGNAGVCPCCGSIDTDYVIVQNPAFIEVWCNTCFQLDNMSYRGTPPTGRNIMTGDEFNDWKDSLKADFSSGKITNYPHLVEA